MSVDVSADFGGPVPMTAIADRAADVLSTLLGLEHGAVPGLLVSAGWARPASSWQALDRPALERLIVGRPLRRDSGKDDSLAFTIHLSGLADTAWLLVMDVRHLVDDHEPGIVGCVSPQRTCVGVALSIAGSSRNSAVGQLRSACPSEKAAFADHDGTETVFPSTP